MATAGERDVQCDEYGEKVGAASYPRPPAGGILRWSWDLQMTGLWEEISLALVAGIIFVVSS